MSLEAKKLKLNMTWAKKSPRAAVKYWLSQHENYFIVSMEESLCISISFMKIRYCNIFCRNLKKINKISCLSFTIEFDVANGKYLKAIKKIASFFSLGMRSRVFLPSTLLVLLYFFGNILYFPLFLFHSSQLCLSWFRVHNWEMRK